VRTQNIFAFKRVKLLAVIQLLWNDISETSKYGLPSKPLLAPRLAPPHMTMLGSTQAFGPSTLAVSFGDHKCSNRCINLQS
jgi:hypothetical protein